MDSFSEHSVGLVTGLAVSFLWATTSLCFTEGGRRIGATLVNILRLVIAAVLLALTYRWSSGEWWPSMLPEQWWALGLSGFVGLAVCDQCLFIAFVEMGPRRTQLLMTTSPLFAATLGLVFLDERIEPAALGGVMLTLAGVAWVITERSPTTAAGPFSRDRRVLRRGLALGLVAAACQAAGVWLAKRGLGEGLLPEEEQLDPLPATLVRMVFGVAGMLPVLAWWFLRRRGTALPGGAPRRWAAGIGFASLGAIGGPYLGVWLSLVAVDRIPIGLAQTVCSLSPVMILPLVGPVYGEKLSARAIGGACVAVAGSSLLFLV